MSASANAVETRLRTSAATSQRSSGTTRQDIRIVAPRSVKAKAIGWPGGASSRGAHAGIRREVSADLAHRGDRPLDVRIPDPLDVHDGAGVDPGQVRRCPDQPVGDRMDGPAGVAQGRPPEPDLLDRALDPADVDDVPDVVLALHQDQDAHQVVEHDALAGERERCGHDAEPGQDRPQIEQADQDQDAGHHHAEPERLGQEVFEGLDPLGQFGLLRVLGSEGRLLGAEDADQQAMDQRSREPVDQQQEDRPEQDRETVGLEPFDHRRTVSRLDVPPKEVPPRRGVPLPQRRSRRSADRAASSPPMPWTPPPGGVDDEHR